MQNQRVWLQEPFHPVGEADFSIAAHRVPKTNLNSLQSILGSLFKMVAHVPGIKISVMACYTSRDSQAP